MGIIGVGNERYAPRPWARPCATTPAVFRFQPEQVLTFSPNYSLTTRASRWTRTRRASCCSAGQRPRITSRTGSPTVSSPRPRSSRRRTTDACVAWPIPPRAKEGRHPRVPRRRHDREWRDALSGCRWVPRRHGVQRAHVCRPHRHRRAALCDGTRRVAIHGRLREHDVLLKLLRASGGDLPRSLTGTVR